MNGVINLYKKAGITSFKAVNDLRRALNEKKAGHTGTLDPDATGVLPVCLGKATKLVEFLMDSDKTYKAVMLLGRSTDTQDISGNIICEAGLSDITKALFKSADANEPDEYDEDINRDEKLLICQKNVEDVFEKFKGEIEQIPPMYSALKVDGVKLVDAARRGEVIERKPRKVTIYDLYDIKLYDDLVHISFTVRCSKGTYIRTLVDGIGKAMGLPACLESLERTGASGLELKDAKTIEEIKQLYDENKTDEFLIPIDSFLIKYEAVKVKDASLKRVLVGNFISENDILDEDISDLIINSKDKIFRIYDINDNFYALYKYDDEKRVLKPFQMFV